MRFKILLFYIAFFSLYTVSKAQIGISNTAPNNNPNYLINNILVGGGVSISNIQFSGSNQQIGYFSTGVSIGMQEGIIMSSGHALDADLGGNPATFNTPASGNQCVTNPNTICNDLYNVANLVPSLVSQSFSVWDINDMCILEFDFVPESDTVSFNYSFGSEEYLTWVNSSYNDVFGFFISGPGITGPYSSPAGFPNGSQNIAVVPNSSPPLPITVSSVHPGYNGGYYNSGNTSISYNGYTDVFTAIAAVIPCETYHISLAIADGSDDYLDSGVFLEANSFSSENPTIDTNTVIVSDTIIAACGETVSLNATLSSSYTIQWSNGVIANSINVGPGSYSYQAVNGNCILYSDTLTIIDYSTSNTISITTCDTYTWIINNQTYTTSGTYVDSSINAAGCMHIDNLNLTIDNSTASIDNVGTHCDSYTWIDSITYTASNNTATFISTNAAGCTHTETLNLTIENSTSNATPITACDTYTWAINNQTYTTSATYVDSSINAAGCTHIDTLNLTIDNSTASIDNVGTHCDSYTWIDAITYTASNNTATFISTNAAGCTHTDTLNLTINNSTSSITPITTCDSYTWGQNNQTYTTSGTYVDSSINAAGCTHTEILHLVIGYTDDLDVLIDETDISCFGYNDGSIILNPYGGTSPYQFLWDNGSANQGIISLSSGTYPFSITDFNGCTIDSVATIQEANQVFLDFLATSPICRYDESTLSIHISNSTSNTYTISLQDSILRSFVIDTNGLLIPEGVPITLTPNFSGEVVIVSITDNTGCTGPTDSVHIEVKQLPNLNLNEDDICVGDSSYILNNATPSGGTYFINDAMTDYFDVENLGTDGYYIRYEYTDPITSCYNEIEEVITINESPKADFTFSPQPTDMNNSDIFFRDNSDDFITSVWDLGDSTIIYDDLSFWHTYSDTGTYMIKYYITNQYNCTDSLIKSLVINPIYKTHIPTAFSPNGDGYNDYFYPETIGGNSYNMKIYSRWGGIIYDVDNGKWDGTMNNNFIIGGLYSYSITVFDFKDKPFIYTGLVTLIK